MVGVKYASVEDMESLMEETDIESLDDPDAGLELREEFEKELDRRLNKQSKIIPHAEVMFML
ncbi:MAG: hypothetical protein SFH39_06215 [Candidatus Magnetobacterium sp. LHC-1]|uniref:Uncharacterized protein n=1 Tax=Candidatus Magnetobacterium casense TaxID=1455061 RepID=A0ABS6RTM9_9BACT|nr:hypothetical protein [Candidatus Magnetobacterium casensis]MBV6339976.1 hypothetical protein [Candidatus Magnetobacterium casensis]